MTGKFNTWLRTGVIAAAVLATSGWAMAQYPAPANGQNPPPAKGQNAPAVPADKSKAAGNNSMTLDDPNAAPVNAEEDAAFKAINDTPSSDQAKRIELGEAFLQKYPNSRYRPGIYSELTVAYLQ
ncbi:MAG: hypothetical protein M3N22_11465, partial [Acidobacteriota bacterium]|nr:hypothetical protein [Acidobacteriota bacterium]